jgi:hypothetical protein
MRTVLRIVVPVAVLLAAGLAGCTTPCTLVGEPPAPSPGQDRLPPVTFQKVNHVQWTDLAQTNATVGEERREVAPNPRHAAGGEPSWAAGNPGKWTHIIIHHSATDFGNAEMIDRMHRQKSWDELGYHFVIDNGNGGSGGAIEVGSRWTKQKHGAHTRVDPGDANYWNEHGIGICLVGNFEKKAPSAAQMASAARLVAFLMQECNIPRQNVLGHGQVPGAQTACPGRRFSYDDLFRRIAALPKN